MGCQREITKKIIEKEADYILALKGNHGDLRFGRNHKQPPQN
jgi:predicted transposase YbfD/YdcC